MPLGIGEAAVKVNHPIATPVLESAAVVTWGRNNLIGSMDLEDIVF
jgi:hypothetical protein